MFSVCEPCCQLDLTKPQPSSMLTRFVKAAPAGRVGEMVKWHSEGCKKQQKKTPTQEEAGQAARGKVLAPRANDTAGSDSAQHIVEGVVLAAELGGGVCEGGEGGGHSHQRTHVQSVPADDVGDSLGLRVQHHIVGGRGQTSHSLNAGGGKRWLLMVHLVDTRVAHMEF